MGSVRQSDEYCARCDYDAHICGGCGDDLTHGINVCATCVKEILKGER